MYNCNSNNSGVNKVTLRSETFAVRSNRKFFAFRRKKLSRRTESENKIF